MNKSKLVKELANKFEHISEKDLALCVNLVFDTISEALYTNKRIEIRGFGAFSLRYRAARQAHNPKTGEKLVTLPKYSPHFKPGKELRERVNESMGQIEIQE